MSTMQSNYHWNRRHRLHQVRMKCQSCIIGNVWFRRTLGSKSFSLLSAMRQSIVSLAPSCPCAWRSHWPTAWTARPPMWPGTSSMEHHHWRTSIALRMISLTAISGKIQRILKRLHYSTVLSSLSKTRNRYVGVYLELYSLEKTGFWECFHQTQKIFFFSEISNHYWNLHEHCSTRSVFIGSLVLD